MRFAAKTFLAHGKIMPLRFDFLFDKFVRVFKFGKKRHKTAFQKFRQRAIIAFIRQPRLHCRGVKTIEHIVDFFFLMSFVLPRALAFKTLRGDKRAAVVVYLIIAIFC